MPAVNEHFAAEYYVDRAIFNSLHESSMLKKDLKEELKPDKQDSKILISFLTSPKTIIEIPVKAFVHSLSGNNRNRRDITTVFDDQDNDFDNNKLTNLAFVTINRAPIVDNDLATENYVDDSIRDGKILKFNKRLENISKFLSEAMFTILLIMTKYTLEIQNLSIILTMEDISSRIGLLNVMIRMVPEKHKNLYDQQKQTVQPVIRGQQI